MIRRAQDLEVFKRAYQLSLIIHKASLHFPKIEQFSIADQLRRASKSVCANLVEGFAKQSHSKAEFKRYLTISIASAKETELWIEYVTDLEYIDLKIADDWKKEISRIIAMLTALRQKV